MTLYEFLFTVMFLAGLGIWICFNVIEFLRTRTKHVACGTYVGHEDKDGNLGWKKYKDKNGFWKVRPFKR